jgi:hypothetical protein
VRISRTKSGVRLAVALFATAAFFALAGSALAAPTAPTDLTAAPPSPTNAAPSVSWTGSTTPDIGFTIVRYEWYVDGVLTGSVPEAGPLTTGPLTLAEGPRSIVVRAVQAGPAAPIDESFTDSAPLGILIDRTPPPTPSAALVGTPINGWYQSLTIDWACGADEVGGSGLANVAACNANEPVTINGGGQTRSRAATDNAGNTSPLGTAGFNFDNQNPTQPDLTGPSPGAAFAAAPKFSWTEEGDAVSGLDGEGGYQVFARYNGQDRLIAVTHGKKSISADFGTGVSPPALPQLVDIPWYVRAIDVAGNLSAKSAERIFRIDPTIPGPATFTNGPGGQTNDTTPSFAWNGSQPSFKWAVLPAGSTTLLQQGSGVSKQATLGTLAQGDYTFRVIQVSAAGVDSEEATYPFTLDTTAPAPPVIDTRPISGSKDITPSFSWRGEAHATFTWKVIGAGGGVVRGDSTTATSLTLAPLTPGPYTFQISQTDRAGNTSGLAVDPFSIIGPSGLQTGTKLSLPTTNHRRLKPRRGITVPTRRPVLRWTPGPRGTTLYNVQLFRVTKRINGKARVTKVFTTFPRARQYRVPSRRTRPATCYVWRVWPYLGTHFTKKPLGISNFCIASKATLRKAAQRKAARAQGSRAAR